MNNGLFFCLRSFFARALLKGGFLSDAPFRVVHPSFHWLGPELCPEPAVSREAADHLDLAPGTEPLPRSRVVPGLPWTGIRRLRCWVEAWRLGAWKRSPVPSLALFHRPKFRLRLGLSRGFTRQLDSVQNSFLGG